MENKILFKNFDEGKLLVPQYKNSFKKISWTNHPTFEGVKLKHIITAKDTNEKFSFHLVQIDPNKKIEMHVHKTQIETHEIISGTGICINDGKKLNYTSGTISIFPMNVPHEIIAGDNGLFLFAKFFPALC